jgi:hypothetical protein
MEEYEAAELEAEVAHHRAVAAAALARVGDLEVALGLGRIVALQPLIHFIPDLQHIRCLYF